jgi:hypothetical protein
MKSKQGIEDKPFCASRNKRWPWEDDRDGGRRRRTRGE